MMKLSAPVDRGRQTDGKRSTKGALEMAALASLWQGRLYGLEIIRFLEAFAAGTGRGPSTRSLTGSKPKGMLTSDWVEAEAGHPPSTTPLPTLDVNARQMAQAWANFAGGRSQLPGLSEPPHAEDQSNLGAIERRVIAMTETMQIDTYLLSSQPSGPITERARRDCS